MSSKIGAARAAFARRGWMAAGVAFSLASSATFAQVVIPQANGSDGPFAPTESVEIPLDAAPNAAWDGVNPNPGAGVGVYDWAQWAVVYRYTSVDIPEGVRVTFRNHPSRAPVVWLVNGDVNIRGEVNLDGMPVQSAFDFRGPIEGGPGGFRGGMGGLENSTRSSSGFGPGGGRTIPNSERISAAHATEGCSYTSDSTQPSPTRYGHASLIPLVGGSGGPGIPGYTGSGGGGAILIAATGNVVVDGLVAARAGYDVYLHLGGSGGSIRFVGNRVSGAGRMEANSQDDCNGVVPGNGFIRIDYKVSNSFQRFTPLASSVQFTGTPEIFKPESTAPSLQITKIEGSVISPDPHAEVDGGTDDYRARRVGTVIVEIQTRNIPTPGDSPFRGVVSLRILPLDGADERRDATWISGDATSSVWRATFNAATRHTVLQASASLATALAAQYPNAFSREVSVAGRTCPADLDDGTGRGVPDEGVTIEDILYFLQQYSDGALPADLDDGSGTNTPDGGVTIDDLLYFLDRFAAGC